MFPAAAWGGRAQSQPSKIHGYERDAYSRLVHCWRCTRSGVGVEHTDDLGLCADCKTELQDPEYVHTGWQVYDADAERRAAAEDIAT